MSSGHELQKRARIFRRRTVRHKKNVSFGSGQVRSNNVRLGQLGQVRFFFRRTVLTAKNPRDSRSIVEACTLQELMPRGHTLPSFLFFSLSFFYLTRCADVPETLSLFSIRNSYGFINIYIFTELVYIFFIKIANF